MFSARRPLRVKCQREADLPTTAAILARDGPRKVDHDQGLDATDSTRAGQASTTITHCGAQQCRRRLGAATLWAGPKAPCPKIHLVQQCLEVIISNLLGLQMLSAKLSYGMRMEMVTIACPL